MARSKLMVTILLAVALASALCGVVALVTTEWQQDIASVRSYGLFETCETVWKVRTCSKYLSVTAAMNAVRAFMIMGEIVVLLAIPLTILHVLGKLNAGNKIIPAVLAVAGLFLLIGCSVYTGESSKANSYGLRYGYSFGLAWASCPLAFIAALFAYLQRDHSYETIP